jgi:hypothetical protein
MSDEELTDGDLRLVLNHGEGQLTRAVAAVKLAKRQDKLEELRKKVDDVGGATG